MTRRWRCFWLDISLDMINRPRVHLDDERRWFAIDWGNGYSDPVWSLQVGPRRQRSIHAKATSPPSPAAVDLEPR